MIGHSGGVAIAADTVARHHSLIHAVVLVSFPGDVNHWRRHMFTKTGSDAFKGDIDSLSVLQDIDQISDALKSDRGTLVGWVEPQRMVLGGRRSLIAPPTSIKTSRGIVAAIKTVPRAIPAPVFCRTSQVSATNQN